MSFVGFLLLTGLVVEMGVEDVWGHGMMLYPPNRSSLWRFDPHAPVNYNDVENFCGGFGIQWGVHNGKCGVCGDNFADPVPRDNENTGKYGGGRIVEQYGEGALMNITIILTANHRGWFSYSLCELNDTSKPEEEPCFKKIKFEDGHFDQEISKEQKTFHDFVRLPEGFKCDHCVLRWNYKTGNTWGTCEDGSTGLGCGPQETFRSCADIAIV